MSVQIGNDWDILLQEEWGKAYYQRLRKMLIQEYRTRIVYPDAFHIFDALKKVSYSQCRVVILGQDPYHEPNQANGMAFSVPQGTPIPPSLINIYKELKSDLNIDPPHHGDLSYWAEQGVLLLNATLTVRAHQANSHADLGWTILTDHIIELLGARPKPMAFVLWGKFAQSKRRLITNPNSLILESPHPSPLSAHRGFFGSAPFSKINVFLEAEGETPIDWKLPEGIRHV